MEDVGFQVGHGAVGAYVGSDGPGFGVVGTFGIRDEGFGVEGFESVVGSCVGLCFGRRVGGSCPFVGEYEGKGRGGIVGTFGGGNLPVGE